ncbi:MAG: hypothetical protein J0J10_20105 [Bosea sp.]|uniref:hypothetical protein n=1 Tax=Bosea sp. (in: a-proteobacteria) TaxID=1871050 RepID=UPI001ACC2422|nr:hypothetical protein [Bosea sp. (in: a-proteobacteria)]MBN9471076.1 hypothetical protein [Bosea sp. (in: a-proteobacteria)]
MRRVWHYCFIGTAIIFLLQAIPYVGIFLMIVGAPFWSVILINLGFGLMAIEEWKDGSRWMVLIPMVWFGGYFAAAGISHWKVHSLNAAIHESNANKTIAFDRTKEDILIVPSPMDSFIGSPLTAQALVSGRGLDQAYQVTQPNGQIQEVSLRRSNCPSGVNVQNGIITSQPIDRDSGAGGRMMFAKGLCQYTSFTAPSRPSIRIRPKPPAKQQKVLVEIHAQDIEVEAPGGKALILKSGSAAPLSWFPTPILGCGLNSGAPSWDCFAFFKKESLYDPVVDLTPNGPDDVVAQALGLPKISIRERYPDAAWR